MNRELWVPRNAQAYVSYLESLRGQRAQRQASTHKAGRGHLSRTDREAVLAKTGRRCHVCGGQIKADWEADHVLAHSGGGLHSIDNYLPAHRVCNNYRWDYLSDEFQEILRLGVWLRTHIETGTALGRFAGPLFVQNEMRRIKRRKQ